jgi:hypothetical protein
MKYKINISEGCTSGGCVEVNSELYSCEDKRYELSLDQREQFHNDLCDELKKLLRDNKIAIQDLIILLPEESSYSSGICDQCGDAMITTYYSFQI